MQQRKALRCHVGGPGRMASLTDGRVSRGNAPGAVAFPPWLAKAVVGSFLVASFTATWGGIHLGGIQPADVFLLFAFVVAAAMAVFGNLRFRIPRWLWAPAVSLLICAAALTYRPIPAASFAVRYEHTLQSAGVDVSSTPGSIVKSAFWVIALVVVPIVALAATALESRAPEWIAASFLAGVCVSSLIALTDLTKLTHFARSLDYQFDSDRQTGLSDHPNTLGLVCVIATPFAVHLISKSRRRWLPCLALVLLGGGVVASGSRGAQLALPVAVLAAVFASPHKKKVVGWLAVTLVASFVGVVTVLGQLVPGILDKLFRFGAGITLPGVSTSASSDEERSQLYAQAWSDFENHPLFGIGIKHINEAHNIYLQIVSAGGSVLLVGMLVYWFGTIQSCRVAKREGEVLGAYLLISVVAWLSIGAVENQLTDRFLYYMVGCAAAIVAVNRVEASADRMTGSVTPARLSTIQPRPLWARHAALRPDTGTAGPQR